MILKPRSPLLLMTGGLAFAVAVLMHHPLRLRWGPLASVTLPLPAWRIGEISFGFFMGLAIALGTRTRFTRASFSTNIA